jgi:hypothetical protein
MASDVHPSVKGFAWKEYVIGQQIVWQSPKNDSRMSWNQWMNGWMDGHPIQIA